MKIKTLKLNALNTKLEIYNKSKYHNFYRYLSFNHLTTLKVIFKIIQKKDKVVIKFKIISLDLSKAFKLCSLTEYMNKSKYLKSLEIGD